MIEFKKSGEAPAFGIFTKGDRKELGEKIEGDLIKAGLAVKYIVTEKPKENIIKKEKKNGR